MKTALITADLTAALFLSIVFVGYDSGIREIPDQSRHYHACLLSCLIGLLLDALSYSDRRQVEFRYPCLRCKLSVFLLDGRGNRLYHDRFVCQNLGS